MSLEIQKEQNSSISSTQGSDRSSSWPIELRQQAIEEFDGEGARAYEPDPDQLLAQKFVADNRLEDAEKVYRATPKKSFSVLAQWAGVLYRLNRDPEASEIYEQALDKVDLESSDLFEVYKNIGNLAVKSGDFERAEEFYNKAYTIEPGTAALLVNYGTLEIQRGNNARAEDYFHKAIVADSDSDGAWTGLALIHYSKSDLELAEGCAMRALDSNVANRTALGLILQWTEEPRKVIPVVARYLDAVGDDGEMSLLQARYLIADGQFDLARIEIERAFQLVEDPTEAFAIRSELDKLIRSRNV